MGAAGLTSTHQMGEGSQQGLGPRRAGKHHGAGVTLAQRPGRLSHRCACLAQASSPPPWVTARSCLSGSRQGVLAPGPPPCSPALPVQASVSLGPSCGDQAGGDSLRHEQQVLPRLQTRLKLGLAEGVDRQGQMWEWVGWRPERVCGLWSW